MPQEPRRMRISFLCGGSTQDGLGHIIRSRSVARLASESMEVLMVAIGDNCLDNLLVDRGIKYRIVKDSSEAQELIGVFDPQVVVLDVLHLETGILRAFKESFMLVGLSPIFNHQEELDIIFARADLPERSNWARPGPELRVGLDYTVVGEHCHPISTAKFRENLEHEVLSVAVSMGGTDAGNKTLQILQAIKGVSAPLIVWVLIGEGYMHSFEDLMRCLSEDRRHEIILAKTNDSMWRNLSACSLAILAGGITTYEAVHVGLPSINTLETSSHDFLIRDLVDRGVCMSAGYPLAKSLPAIVEVLNHTTGDRSELMAMHRKCKSLIDGRGAHRIVGEIRRYYQHLTEPDVIRVRHSLAT